MSRFTNDRQVMRSLRDSMSGVEFLEAEDVAQGSSGPSPSPNG